MCGKLRALWKGCIRKSPNDHVQSDRTLRALKVQWAIVQSSHFPDFEAVNAEIMRLGWRPVMEEQGLFLYELRLEREAR